MSNTIFAPMQTITSGNCKVTYIPDGGAYISSGAMYPTSDAEGWTGYPELTDDQARVIVSLGGFLIETGDRKILMDLGYGPYNVEFPGFGPFMGGKYLESLAATGVKPEEITDVFYTHLHLDHVGWTSVEKDGKRVLTFPNARYMCSETEWNFWPGDESGLGPDPETVVKPLTGVIQFVKDGEEIAPGLTAYAAPGHTPGFMTLKLETGADTIWFCADIFHCTVQFSERKWHAVFDIDPAAGEVSRVAKLPEFVKDGVIMADGHFSNGAFGKLTEEDGKYIWTLI
ncbi:MAG: MBL fold metallo-hydrolase [Firmicutes bacterium]|nr:MBL fold metallo-hydrolase [Bacillota bacterium]